VIDMGFFHTLSDEERVEWRGVLADLLAPGGAYVMMSFSELVPGTCGPRRIAEADVRDTFAEAAGFRVTDLERATILSRREADRQEVAAWLARIVRA
jgi:hypothetical protein